MFILGMNFFFFFFPKVTLKNPNQKNSRKLLTWIQIPKAQLKQNVETLGTKAPNTPVPLV